MYRDWEYQKSDLGSYWLGEDFPLVAWESKAMSAAHWERSVLGFEGPS